MKEKFLMVLAVLDEETQEKLKKLQNKIIFECESKGSQTINIPFHISLGSFPLADKDILQSNIKQLMPMHQIRYMSPSSIRRATPKPE